MGLSASVFLLEVLLTRIFSVTLSHHFAFAAISIGMLGLATAGVRISLSPKRFTRERAEVDIPRAALLFALATLGALVLLVRFGVSLEFSWKRVLILVCIYCVAVVPFYFGGLAMTLVFTHHRDRFARLYAADLAAAGLAGLLVVPLLVWLGGPGAVAASAVLSLLGVLAAFPALPRKERLASFAVVALCVGLVAFDGQIGALKLRKPKGRMGDVVLFEAWNALSRLAVYDTPMGPWSLGPNYKGPVAMGYAMDIDANAATPIVPAGDKEGNQYLKFELTAAGYSVAPKGRALVIGSGGGRDILTAFLHDMAHVNAVEINPIIVDDVMRGKFADYSGHIYEDPRLDVHIGDGRTFVRRSSDRFDIIQLSLVDTWASTAAGAFALSENNLYTVEALVEYIEHLNDGGVLSLIRWDGGETMRLVVMFEEAARRLGIRDFSKHLAIVSSPQTGLPEAVATNTLFRRTPFDEASIAPLRRQVEAAGFSWKHDPLQAIPGRISEIARSQSPLAETQRTDPIELSPSTDDWPFFFYRPAHDTLGELRAHPQLLFLGGNYLLLELLALATLLGGACLLVPLARRGREALGAKPLGALRAMPYFLALGAGFMLVEVSLMQRFVLYLGHPTHALTAVLAGLLVGAGAGSFLSGRFSRAQGGAPDRTIAIASLVAAGVVLLSDPLHAALFAATQDQSMPAKLVLTELLILLMGASLGTLMPLGMSRIAATAPRLVPWAWGINGFASVVGSCVAALACMSVGFSMSFKIGAACYVAAAVLGYWGRPVGE